jgi:hypothetical protein
MTSQYELNAASLFDGSARQYGLQEYVAPGIRQRFIHMIGLMNDFGKIEAADYPAAVETLKALVAKRLLVERDWRQHPEILDGEIRQPFFIIGSARAGTTFTQMILAMDEGHRTPRYRDIQHPAVHRGVDPAADAASLEEQDRYVEYMVGKSPRMMAAHPYLDQQGESEAEDEYVYSLDFNMVYPLWFLKVPNMPQALPPADPVAAFRFHKNMLRQFQWKTPTRRWVGKGVIHQYVMSSLLKVYPDAVCFWIHREPEQLMPSLLEILELQYKPFNGDLYRVTGEDLLQQIRQGVQFILGDAATNDPRVHHIRFKDMVRDPAAVIGSIYEARGIPFTDSFARKIKACQTDPAYRADRYGKFEYSLDKIGASKQQLRSMFKEYCDRFGV